jgi:hypothetical protein
MELQGVTSTFNYFYKIEIHLQNYKICFVFQMMNGCVGSLKFFGAVVHTLRIFEVYLRVCRWLVLEGSG